MKPFAAFSAGLLAAGLLACHSQPAAHHGDRAVPVWQSAAYTLYRDSVVQGPHRARAVSATELVSNYRSPANAFLSPDITFKFSLNGKDNEMAPGQDHHFVALPRPGGGMPETPVIPFGKRFVDATPVPANAYLAPNTAVKIRLDLRAVLAAFRKDGYFATFKGEKIYRADFKHVFVAGGTAPLSWDFDNLVNKPALEMKDTDGDGIYEATLVFNAPQDAKTTATHWKQSINTADFPQYSSEYPLADALYNLSLEEARRAVEPDSTFRTGKEWAGVWTRDISYSIILAQAALQPRVAMKSLLRKVSADGRIVQDTGTGGAYPCSTDRQVWAVAAWEIYQVTGDAAWLRRVYPIVKRSIEADRQNAYDPETGLVRGESSFLDWREQTYPRWMQPADIATSQNLGTNAVHFQANAVLARMAQRLGDTAVAARHTRWAADIKDGLNEYLWDEDRGYYGQYRYGRLHPVVSPRAEALGEALSVYFGVAGDARARTVVEKTPTTPYGISCIYPQIPGLPPYHNNAVWPFVQSFWALAGARTGNEASLTESMAAVYRPAALFLTNKENFVAENGDYAGTQINSGNMLWSLSGNLALVYKVLFGMQFEDDRLVFRPFVPRAFGGARKLTNFRYRRAVLDVEMSGFGREIRRITLDGQPLAGAAVPATLVGRHAVRIVLSSQAPAAAPVTRVANAFAPETPALTYANGRLLWGGGRVVKSEEDRVRDPYTYLVLKNGRQLDISSDTEYPVPATEDAEYQVLTLSQEGAAPGAPALESFASEPLRVGPHAAGRQYPLTAVATPSARPYQGASGRGFVEISTTQNTRLAIPITVPAAGRYALDFRYANGNGPTNTDNKCALRTLRRGPALLGTVVLPQRGVAEWSNWGFSNAVLVRLEKGPHTLTLALEPANANMNGAVNQAMLDYLRVRRVE